MSQAKNRDKKNSKQLAQDDSEPDSFECDESLGDISNGDGSRTRRCTCLCRCGQKQPDISTIERKRLKRKQNKQKKKNKIKEVRQKAIVVLQMVMRDIYALKVDLQSVEAMIQECLAAQPNGEILYGKINEIIRSEVDLIRREISSCLKKYEEIELQLKNCQNEEEKRQLNSTSHTLLGKIFDRIDRIWRGSPEIQKVINMFVKSHFDSNEYYLPLQTNLDKMTLRFLYRNDLEKSDSFQLISKKVMESNLYEREKHLYTMLKSANEFDMNEDLSDSGYESGDDLEQGSTIDSAEYQPKRLEQQTFQQQNVRHSDKSKVTIGSRTNKRRQKRRRLRSEFEIDEVSVLMRLHALQFDNPRSQCRVPQDWIENIKLNLEYITQRKADL